MINFFLYLRDNKNEILAELMPEMERINTEWLAHIKSIVNEYIPDIDIYQYEQNNQMLENRLSKKYFLILTC